VLVVQRVLLQQPFLAFPFDVSIYSSALTGAKPCPMHAAIRQARILAKQSTPLQAPFLPNWPSLSFYPFFS
jgi:hypothetical protein